MMMHARDMLHQRVEKPCKATFVIQLTMNHHENLKPYADGGQACGH